MPRADVVVATGTVSRDPELHLIGKSTQVCVLQIAVDGFRFAHEMHRGIPRPAYLTVTVSERQALNCAANLRLNRSVVIEAQLVRAGRSAEGIASVIGFIGKDSRARQLAAA
jgi:single-stranded DNA-binding protein